MQREEENRLVKILESVANRVQRKVDSIDHVHRFPRTGIEAWFKVEVIAALDQLGDRVLTLNNKGPDMTLSNNLHIELKGATDFTTSWLRDGALKDNVPCLFLGSAEFDGNISRFKMISSIRILGLKYINGSHKWVVGLIVPMSY